MNERPFDLSGVKFVKRIVLGTQDPATQLSIKELDATMELLNRCLSESPKGWIVGTEKNFTVVNMGEHQVVLQWLVYHIGFSRKPIWLD